MKLRYENLCVKIAGWHLHGSLRTLNTPFSFIRRLLLRFCPAVNLVAGKSTNL